MLSNQTNQRLTRIGPGTPMGAVMRRYWHPVATATELEQEPVLAVRLLGEDLALYRTEQGQLGLVAQRCPHRGASLAYGIPEEDGLRCPYHGWKFSAGGQCLEQPAEPAESTFKDRIKIPAYPVQEMGGLLWAYLGSEPAPLLPRYDLFVRDDLEREIGITRLPCNWLQIMENSLDPVHLEYLHTRYFNYVMRRRGLPEPTQTRHHQKIAFDVFEFGIQKRRLLEGQSEDADDWRIGHPLLWPGILAIGDHSCPRFEIRVPMDDTHTLHFWYFGTPRAPGAPAQAHIPVYDNPFRHDNGALVVETVNGQDMMVWVTQGDVSDRTTERLGTSDQGVILLRELLEEQIRRVERGEDPLGVLRDPARNQPMIELSREGRGFFVPTGEMMAIRTEDPLEFFRVQKRVS